MIKNKALLVKPLEGFSPQVGALLSMMEVARATTKHRVSQLNSEQLDWRFDPQSNSVGMLLGHIAALEELYTIEHIEQRAATEEENAWLTPRLDLGRAGLLAMQGTDLDAYLTKLDKGRARLIEALRAYNN